MEPKEHLKRHKELHKALSELVADWIGVSESMKEGKLHLPSKFSILDLIKWSSEQCKEETHAEPSRHDSDGM